MNIFTNIGSIIEKIKKEYKPDKKVAATRIKTKGESWCRDIIFGVFTQTIDGILYLRNMIFEMLEHIFDILYGFFIELPFKCRQWYL